MREGGEEWRRKGEVGGGGEGMWRGWRRIHLILKCWL